MYKDKTIGKIVKMEERIHNCSRCRDVRICCQRPSTGKGDLDPDIMIIFPNECDQSWTKSDFSGIRQEIARMAGGKPVYHTFMVRCQPRICTLRRNKGVLLEGALVNGDNKCLLTRQECEGLIGQPDDQQTMNCLHFMLEEIEIFAPKVIITVGEQTYQYVFRAFGLLDPFQRDFSEVKNKLYRSSEYLFMTADFTHSNLEKSVSDLEPLFQIIEGPLF